MSSYSYTWEGVPQEPDGNILGTVRFRAKNYKIMHNGLKAILIEIQKFDNLSNDLGFSDSPYSEQSERLERMVEYGEAQLADINNDYNLLHIPGISVLSARYLKAGILLEVEKMERERDTILRQKGTIPSTLLLAYEEKIRQVANIAEAGIFNGLRPAEIFFEITDTYRSQQNVTVSVPTMSSVTSCPAPSVVVSVKEVPILDDELRSRCLGLLSAMDLAGGNVQQQFDTIIREMSAILENRIKAASGLTGKTSWAGEQLVGEVFKVASPLLKVSDDPAIQQSALLLFKGYFGFVRNDVMHNIVKSYTRERMLQLLGYVDYLLFILSKTQPTIPTP